MSYNKNTRRTGARASAVPLPPPPPLTDLAEWPYLESSAARARNASATATGGSNSAQQKLGDVSEGSLPRQDVSEAEAQDEYSMVTEKCTTNLTRQAVLEPEAQSGTAISRDSGMLAQEMPPEQQPGESFQDFVDRHRTLALSVPVTWEDGGPSSLAPPNGDEPPPNNGAGASHPARDADSAPFPTEWWAALPEDLSPEKAKAVWLEKGRPNCTACGRAHPPPHNDLVARQNKQQRLRQQKLEHRTKQQAAAAAPEVKKEPEEAAPFTTRAQSSAAAGKRQKNRCQRCGNFHSGPCRAPWCDKCGSAHFKKKGEPCKKRDKEVIAGAVSAIQDDPALARDLVQAGSERPGTSEEMRTLMAAILASGDPAQAAAMTRAYVELRDERAASQQQQQQQQDRPSPRRNQREGSSRRPRGRSASPRREDSGGGGGYRERSPNARRSDNKGGGRGPSRRPPRNG